MRRPEPQTEPLTRRADAADTTRVLDGGAAGLVLDRYRLERRLGAGGFGVVWLAWDERLEREVAVKAVPREPGDERGTREARAAARLNHPGIVALYELDADEHDVYLVSELVRGRTFAELMRVRALSDRDVARVGEVLCAALEHAHARGVIHRDVKPQNVMVVAEPAAGAGFAKLADFGVAHVASGDSLTRTGDVVGTLAYMAPEQAEGTPATPACDVYSLALTLYEAWTGSNPVRAGGPAATARRLGRPIPSLASARRDLPLDLCDVVDAALAPEPELRPSPAELGAALAAAEPELDEQGGLEDAETLARVGLERTRRWRFGRRAHSADEPTGVLGRRPAAAVAPFLLARASAGVAAGLLFVLALTQLGPTPPFSPWAAAGVVAVLTALLPRVGWLCAAAAACLWLASPEADRQGTALLLAAAAAPIPLLMPRAGLLWSVPVLAPALGVIALAPAFVGVAALAPTVARRAGLAAAGLWWLLLAEPLTGDALLLGAAPGTEPRGDWEGSLTAAAGDALLPVLASPVLLVAAVWAGAAVLLALVVRGRSTAVDAVGAALWAAGLIAVQVALGDALAGEGSLDELRGAVAGPVIAALVVLAVSATVPPQAAARAQPAPGQPTTLASR